MLGRMNNNGKMVKVVSVALSIYMAVSPIVVHAEEIENTENISEQVEVSNESTDSVEEAAETVVEAVENDVITVEQADYETAVEDLVSDFADLGADVSNIEVINPLENDTEVLVENKINDIENEAIKEVADAIVNVDMTDVNAALDTVAELVEETVTDEVVADEVVATADALIEVYEAQSEAALDALKAISEKSESDAISISEDGSVSVDWNAATDEVKALYDTYKGALEAKSDAESAKEEALKNQPTKEAEVEKLNTEVTKINKNQEISKSKLNKNDDINSIIDKYAADKKGTLKAKDTFDDTINDDMYRFYVNVVENGVVYGCLTYYDSANKTILRKNFSISADGKVNHEYVPKDKWVKGNPGSTNAFGNGSNYIAAYVDDSNKSTYIKNGEFQGIKVSDLLRDKDIQALNSSIDARNNALKALDDINKAIETATEDINKASEIAEAALEEYKKTVAKYKTVASLESEIRKNEVEKAMLEYVKAEVDVFKKQQVLDQIEEIIDNPNTTETTENDNVVDDVVVQENTNTETAVQDRTETVVQENIETLIDNIANNLGVEPEVVEDLVVQTIINTEDNYVAVTNDREETAAEVSATQTTADTVVTTNAIRPAAVEGLVASAQIDAEDSNIDTASNSEEAAVAGARRNSVNAEEVVEETAADAVEEIVNAKVVTNSEVSEEEINDQNEAQNIVTIEENKIALANVGEDVHHNVNWLPFIIALTLAAWMMFVLAKKDQEKEEA